MTPTTGPGGTSWRKPGRLYEEIARDLGERIVQGDPEPGEFLPTEHLLVERYGASRNIVREAVKLLGARGLVETIHGRGSRVLPSDRWGPADRMVRLVREDPRVPQNLLELRTIVEVAFAGLAAERADDEQLAAMREAVERTRATTDPWESMTQDARFHQLLADATGNSLLPMLLEPVEELLRAHREATVHNTGVLQRSIDAHAAILERIEARDVEGAQDAMRLHLKQVAAEAEQLRRP